MKKVLPFVIFMLLSAWAGAQSDTTRRKVKTYDGLRHELNFGVSNLTTKNTFQNFLEWAYYYDYFDYYYYYSPF